MKGIVLMDQMFRSYLINDRYEEFARLISDDYGFPFHYTQRLENPQDYDFILTIKSPQHSNMRLLMDLQKVRTDTKVVGYFADLHGENPDYKANIDRYMSRCDLILSNSHEEFMNHHAKYINKFILFPNFMHSRYSKFTLNTQPKMRCLISGAADHSYPLRLYLVQNKHKANIDTIPHPPNHVSEEQKKQANIYVADKYANTLHEFFCGVATPTKWNYVVAKYFEVPATGSLLLAQDVKDLEPMGMKANEHFVPITIANAIDVINHVLAHPNDYNEMREHARQYTILNHSMEVRYAQFKQILKERLCISTLNK